MATRVFDEVDISSTAFWPNKSSGGERNWIAISEIRRAILFPDRR